MRPYGQKAVGRETDQLHTEQRAEPSTAYARGMLRLNLSEWQSPGRLS